MLYGIVIGIHVLASLVLIAVILLQAGRGGGLSVPVSEMKYGQAILKWQVAKNGGFAGAVIKVLSE